MNDNIKKNRTVYLNMPIKDLNFCLTKPKNAVVRQYQKFSDMKELTIIFVREAFSVITEKVVMKNLGLQGPRSKMEDHMLVKMFHLPSARTNFHIKISEKMVAVNNWDVESLSKQSEHQYAN